jgi:hypothetical protein
VKLLDFGIAKAAESQVSTSGRSPTLLTPALTEAKEHETQRVKLGNSSTVIRG